MKTRINKLKQLKNGIKPLVEAYNKPKINMGKKLILTQSNAPIEEDKNFDLYPVN